jgi:hypothetical protein
MTYIYRQKTACINVTFSLVAYGVWEVIKGRNLQCLKLVLDDLFNFGVHNFVNGIYINVFLPVFYVGVSRGLSN